LETQINISTDAIDIVDWQGRTALSWAAAKGDTKAVNLLLEHGADPNIPSFNGSTPLMFASRAANPSCIELLLAAGARPDDRNSWQVNALKYAMRIEPSIRYILPLLRGGADPNSNHGSQSTPLVHAVNARNVAQVTCLVEYGARPCESDGGLFGLLNLSLSTQDFGMVTILLQNFSTELENFERDRLLVVVEMVGTPGTVKILTELLSARPCSEEEGDDNDVDDLFFDALEVQE